MRTHGVRIDTNAVRLNTHAVLRMRTHNTQAVRTNTHTARTHAYARAYARTYARAYACIRTRYSTFEPFGSVFLVRCDRSTSIEVQTLAAFIFLPKNQFLARSLSLATRFLGFL